MNMIFKIFTMFYSFFLRNRFALCGSSFRIYLSAIINNPKKIVIGDNVTISCHALLNCQKKSKNGITLNIGSGCRIGRFCHINAYEKVIIEKDVLIAERVHISDCQHNFDNSKIPIMYQGASFKGDVVIKSGAWIGSGAVILPGVTIGKNSVVGANAVVTKDVPDNHIARGVPARMFTKKRRVKSG